MLSQTFSIGLRNASIWGGAIAAILVVNSCTLFAAGKAERTRSAEQLVREALHREIYGQDQERRQLLQQALEQSPDYAPAKWAQGYVRYQNRWIKAEELQQIRNEDGRLVKYEKIRGNYTDTIKGQLALAELHTEGNGRPRKRKAVHIPGFPEPSANSSRQAPFPSYYQFRLPNARTR